MRISNLPDELNIKCKSCNNELEDIPLNDVKNIPAFVRCNETVTYTCPYCEKETFFTINSCCYFTREPEKSL